MKKLTIGLITGEASGDLLAADLLLAFSQVLAKKYESSGVQLEVVGVLGPKVIRLAQDISNPIIYVKPLYPSDSLAIMGFIEPLKHLPRLLTMRKRLVNTFINNPPDIFIGVDSPDFNLGIEKKLKQAGIKTVHYVSPSVWAWRKGRIKTIKKAVDLMLVLFPFEQKYYQNQQVNSVFVGHPLADNIPIDVDKTVAREQLLINIPINPTTQPLLAILPGSRISEVNYLGPLYLKTALVLKQKLPELQVIIPFASAKMAKRFSELRQQYDPNNQLNLLEINQQAQLVMQASDIVLITSGTATLEAMLCNRPMVVAFKTSRFNAFLARLLVKLKYFSLPNLLFNQAVVPEFFQEQATVNHLVQALEQYINDPVLYAKTQEKFIAMHKTLQLNASQTAAHAIKKLLFDSH